MHALNWNSRVLPFEFLQDFHPKQLFPILIGGDPSLICFYIVSCLGAGVCNCYHPIGYHTGLIPEHSRNSVPDSALSIST